MECVAANTRNLEFTQNLQVLYRAGFVSASTNLCYEECINYDLIPSSANGDRYCLTVACAGFNQPMRWVADLERIDEGRFICAGNRNHKKSVREDTIFDGLRLPLQLSYRPIFKDFLEQVPINSAAFVYGVDTKTVTQHYNYARRLIHQHMEMQWEREPVGQQNIREQEPQHLIIDGLPEGANAEYNTPAIELDETLLTHLPQPGALRQIEKQCWALGAYDRATCRTIVHVVSPTRSREVIEPVLNRMIARPGLEPFRVYTDGFPVYRMFQERENFIHFVAVRAQSFGECLRHTKHIEAHWSHLKNLSNFDNGLNLITVEQVAILTV